MPDPAWVTIADSRVRHQWSCPECGATEFVAPDWYQDSGTPVCAECDEDMRYVSTQIQEEA